MQWIKSLFKCCEHEYKIKIIGRRLISNYALNSVRGNCLWGGQVEYILDCKKCGKTLHKYESLSLSYSTKEEASLFLSNFEQFLINKYK